MSIESRKKGNITILKLTGQLTLGPACEKLRDGFQTALEAGERSFVLDMLEVPFVVWISAHANVTAAALPTPSSLKRMAGMADCRPPLPVCVATLLPPLPAARPCQIFQEPTWKLLVNAP